MKRILCLPWPPSVNGYWRSFRGRQILSKKARKYQEETQRSLWMQWGDVLTFQAPSRLQVTIEAYPPDRRTRDLDNLTKGLLDALTHASVWEDDSQIDDLRIVRREVRKPGHVEVSIEEL